MTPESPESPRRAIVLGGGGIAGIAWHLGMLAELLDGGVPLGEADLVIGTSAGSVAGSILRFGQVQLVYSMQATADMPDLPSGDPTVAPVDMATFRDRLVTAIQGATSAEDARARLGRAAVESSAGGSESVLVSTLAAQFPALFGWPASALGICVVDATTGEFRVLDKSSGVALSRAVAASCSVPLVFPPVEIDGVPYIDGGARSATNADVVAGFDKVLVLSCGPEDPASPMGPQLDAAVAGLRNSGADVLLLGADADSLAAFGTNSLAPTSRVPSAQAGRRQAAGELDAVRAFWG
ncbi:patatin-like phospholipase family protein [Frondihabitans cladoniiphilus]|uniref:Patatin-like phospholipase family protein n=1 Tax=Frondihabitans cladoniiphilus TaxID=715785 RepID=A0ABP8WAD5_9MICO